MSGSEIASDRAATSGGTAIAYIDGGARGTPGPAGYGVHIEQPDGTIVELKASLGTSTNNAAEYQGLLAGVSEDQIFSSGLCTAMHLDVLTSYRAEGAQAGRLAGVIRVAG